MVALIIVIAVVVVLGLFVAGTYNGLVKQRTAVDGAWAQIDVQLKRRYDLIPNLVSTVKGSAKHEEETLTKVMEARAAATQIKLSSEDLTDPAKMAAFQKAQDNLKGSLSRLLVAQESYPDLKANAAFRDLQTQLEGTENRILRAREEYNAAVKTFNAELGKVGGSVVNKVTGKPFKPRVYFAASAEAQAAPKVSF